MTDEVEPTHELDTGNDDATLTEDTAQHSGHDEWQVKYQNLQPEYTRATQELKAEREARLALEQQFQALQQAGEADDEDYEEYDFEDSQARQKIADLEAKLSQWEQKAAEADEANYITDELEAIEADAGRELGQKASDWIGRLAQSIRDDKGNPDVRAAYKEWLAVIEDERKHWVKTKKVTKPGSGSAAVEKIDKSDPKQRQAYANQRWAELTDS